MCLTRAEKISKKVQRPLDGIFVVPRLRVCEKIRRTIGTGKVGRMLKGETEMFWDWCKMRMASTQQVEKFGRRDMIIALHADQKMLEKIERNNHCEYLIVTPLGDSNYSREWVKIFQPWIHWMEDPPDIKSHIEDLVLEEALVLLTNSVNLNTGLVHRSDRFAAIRLFRRLRAAEVDWEPKKIQYWARRHGWKPHDARELEDVALGIKNRKALRGGKRNVWVPDIVENLKKKVKQKQRNQKNKGAK